MIKKIFASFLWLFPIFFIIDGSLSVIDDITSYFLPVKMLSSVRENIANIVVLLTVPYIFALFFFKTKRALPYWILPAYNITFTVFSSFNILNLISATSLFSAIALALSPHWIYNKHPSYFVFQLLFSLIQVGVGIYSTKYCWSHRLEVERKGSRYILAGVASFSFIGFYALTVVGTIISMFVVGAGGYLGLSGDRVTSIEKVFEKDGKVVHLIPMIHVGSKEFYKELSQLNATKKTLILLEGVSDEKNLLTPISYRGLATSVGLDEQANHFKPMACVKQLQKNISYIVSDVDASEFNQDTRDFLNNTMKMLDEKSFFEQLLIGNEDLALPDDVANLSTDLIERRNKKVLGNLASNESKFEVFYIPWGAMHLPEIEREMIKIGYKEVSKKERPVMSLTTMLGNI